MSSDAAIQEYFAPESLAEAVRLLRGGDATVLAGGTDLMPQTQAGRVKFGRSLVNIRRIAELRGIGEAGGTVRIGALTSVAELMESETVRARLPVLVEAGDHFASAQLRNAATIGGNICNASPAGDLLVPLLVLDAEVELASDSDGALATRRLPLADFFTGPGKTRRAPNELLVAVNFDKERGEPAAVMRYKKVAAGAETRTLVIEKIVLHETPQTAVWYFCFDATVGEATKRFNIPDKGYEKDEVTIATDLALPNVRPDQTCKFVMKLDDVAGDECTDEMDNKSTGSFTVTESGSQTFKPEDHWRYTIYWRLK